MAKKTDTELPEEENGETIEDLFMKEKPLYHSSLDMEEMNKNNKRFYENASKKAFNTLFKEEQERLDELVGAQYYPEEKEEEVDDITLMARHLNLV